MTTLTERLKWLVEADATSAITAFEKTGVAAETSLKKAETSSQKIGGTLTKVGAGATAFAGIAGAALFEASKKFEETALKAGEFSDATFTGVDMASRWIAVSKDVGIGADTIETSMGKMNKTLGATPDLFDQMNIKVAATKTGAEDVSGTFLNVIAHLQGIEDAGLRSAEAAKIFGRGWQGAAELLAMNTDDIKKRLASVSDQRVINEDELAKAKAFRDDLQNLGHAATDFALAIGQGAMPVVGAFAKGLGGLVHVIGSADAVTGGMAGRFLALGAAGLGLVGVMSMIAGQAVKMSARFQNLGMMGDNLKIAMIGAAVGLAAYSLEQKHNADNNAAFVKGLEAVTRGTDDQVVTVTTGLITAWEHFFDMKPADVVHKMATENLAATIRTRDLAAADADFAGQLEKRGVTVNMLTSAINGEEAAQKRAADTTAVAATATADYTKSTQAATAATGGHAIMLAAVKAATGAATKAVDENKRANRSLVDDVTRGLDEIKSGWDVLRGDISNDKSWADLQLGFIDLKSKIKDAWDAAGKGAADGRQKTLEAQAAIDDMKTSVLDYNEKVLKLPKEQLTKILTLIDQGSLDAAQAALDNLTRNYTANVSITSRGGAGYSTTPKFAEGGHEPATPGGVQVTVAEAGQGEWMIPDDKMAALGGDTFNVTLNVKTMPTPDEVARALKEWKRRNGPNI